MSGDSVLTSYKKTHPSMAATTLVLLLRDKKVLLAMKKRGFGAGRWNGVGGKVQSGETLEEAALRETTEEIGVEPHNLRKRATLHFYFPETPLDKHWNQTVHVYLC